MKMKYPILLEKIPVKNESRSSESLDPVFGLMIKGSGDKILELSRAIICIWVAGGGGNDQTGSE